MKELIEGFSNQIYKGLEISENYQFKIDNKININNVVVSGLGGSGIGGTIIQNFSLSNSVKPIFVNKNYNLPKFADQNTLLICCSYSGNTEETIYVLKQGLERGCNIVCITSGGKLMQMAKGNGLDCIVIPAGFPPRSCFGYSIIQLFKTFQYFNILDVDYVAEFTKAAQLIDDQNEAVQAEAKRLAKIIAFKMPIIYTENDMEGLGIRWRQQFNENGKMLCWHNVIPEMNHNEIVGWRDVNDDRCVFFIHTNGDFERSTQRMSLTKAAIEQYTNNIFDIYSKGDSFITDIIYLNYLGDWISWFLSVERAFDATEVYVIENLKTQLCD